MYAGGNFYLYYINNGYDFIPYVAIEASRENKEIIEVLKNIIENDGQGDGTQQNISRRLFLLGANKQMVLALTSVIAVEHLQQSMVDWLAEVHEQGGTWTLHGFTQKLNQLRTPPAPATEM